MTHGGKNWVLVAAMVPGRTKVSVVADGMMRCDPAASTGRLVIRTANGHQTNINLVNAAERYGGKNWEKIAAGMYSNMTTTGREVSSLVIVVLERRRILHLAI
jgi:hypothetical protein